MDNDDYKVGYKSPPKTTRFQPGQSGNPRGRPRGTKNLARDLEEELRERIRISEGGQSRTVTKQRAMVKTLFAKTLKGDSRAANVLINLIRGLLPQDTDKPDEGLLNEDDAAILEAYAERLASNEETSEEEKT